MQRFQLAVYPDDSGEWKNVDRWPDTAAKNRAFALFERLDKLNPQEIGATLADSEDIPFLRFTPEAQELFDDWRADLERKIRSKGEHLALEAHLSKYRSLMPSLALISHILEVVNGTGKGAVSEHAATMGAAWGDFLEAHARRIYQCVTQHALFSARRLAERVKEGALASPFTSRDVYRNQWSGLTDPDSVRAATEVLEDLNWLRSEKLPTTGRTKLQYHINPRLKGKEKKA
jgi:putative DNA primase/helicase